MVDEIMALLELEARIPCSDEYPSMNVPKHAMCVYPQVGPLALDVVRGTVQDAAGQDHDYDLAHGSTDPNLEVFKGLNNIAASSELYAPTSEFSKPKDGKQFASGQVRACQLRMDSWMGKCVLSERGSMR